MTDHSDPSTPDPTGGHGIYDRAAEITVAGCAVFSDRASRHAHQHVTPNMFHDPALGRLFTITPELPAGPCDFTTHPWQPELWEQRAQLAAILTGLDHTDVRAVVTHRLVLQDVAGSYARRVINAHATREHLARLADTAHTYGYTLTAAA